jgi:hypothetical protein
VLYHQIPSEREVKLAEILHRLNAQHGQQTLSHTSVYDWHNKVSDGCKQVWNLTHYHVQPTAEYGLTFTMSKEMILGNR